MKIVIAGYGLEGQSNYRYWAADSTEKITIADQKQPDSKLPYAADTIIGENAFDQLQDFDLVIRTAGLAPRKIITNGKIWSATNEFFDKCPAVIIGVTGSKGKGTTASLIASILKVAGKKVWLLGNIGVPSLDVLGQIKKNDIVVFELSSFQLWDLEKSPHTAVILYIEQEHLDVHYSMDDYVNAKSNITKYQSDSDVLIFNQSNQYAKSIAISSQAKTVGYPDENTAHVRDDSFYYGEQIICSIKALQLVGQHNLDNACAAIDAIWEFTINPQITEEGLSNFKGLQHRLQIVREFDGIRYIDDSYATTPGAAIAALRSFQESKVIILGGSSKGSDFSEIANELKMHDVNAILIGEESEKIATACKQVGFSNFEIVNYKSMEEIVKYARLLAKPNSVVLLSPACASFGMFKNYSDRGDQFTNAVNRLL